MAATTAASDELANHHWALRELPAFPAIATKLLKTLNNDSANVKQLVDLLRSDAALSAEILRRANSAAMGLSSQVSSLQHAILLLGFEQIRQLAMAVTMSTYFKPAMKIESLQKCWRHSLATAHLADRIARGIQFEHDRAYTAGLLHHIGLFGLMVHYPNEYDEMFRRARTQPVDLLQQEQALFDLNHCEAGDALAEMWNFPEEIRQAAARHHEEPDPSRPDLVAVIVWASRMAAAIGYDLAKPPVPYQDARGSLPERVGAAFPEDPAKLASELKSKVDAIAA